MIAATFEDARQIVARRFASQHRPSQGTFVVAEWGYEDAGLWVVFYGPAGEANATSLDDAAIDPIITFVLKDSGEIIQEPYLEVGPLLDQMWPAGHWPGRVL